ncbi:MAG TPA: Crp/Fnr family transcriptional regulator [Burkholderiaceae bacterium]|nr:Crp/Fnr family transcriptional regulator [Burkholderiaceae bacterium]HRA78708.1 Crp/Fnr family transcriptional regulator [Burkholderiaceae bacterium]
MHELDAAQHERVRHELIERSVPAGGFVCRKGEPVEHWIGVVTGLVKISSVSLEGKSVTFTGVAPGGWFGEGSMLKDEPRRYDAVALRDSRIALMPRSTFQWLLDTSIAFNRYLLIQLNERLGQFIGTVEIDRLLGPDARVARCLAQLFNPHLYPGLGLKLEISQGEIGYLTGLSRQRVNQALRRLESEGLLKVDYGAVTVLSLDGLREFDD